VSRKGRAAAPAIFVLTLKSRGRYAVLSRHKAAPTGERVSPDIQQGGVTQTEAISSAVSALNSPGCNIGSSMIDPMLSRCSPTTLFWKCPNIRFTW